MTKLKPYPKYKDSGIEWIGEVPEGWRSTEVRWTFQRAKLTNCPTETLLSVYRDYGVIPKDSRNDNWNRESEDLSAYQLVCEGDLVTNKMKAWQGSIAVSSYRGIVSPAYYVYKSIHNERNEYFHYLLRSKPYILHYGIISKGIRINQWDLEHEAFRLTPILLPSKNEQQAIAAYLDRETAQIDALIAKKARSIELLREKRQAMITHAVTKGLNPNAKMKDSGIEWIGEVPEGWEIKRVKFLLSESLKYGANESGDSFEEEAPRYIRITDLDENGNLRDASIKTLSLSKALPYMLKDGDILFARSGATVGKTFIYKEQYGPACYAGYLIKARPNLQKVLPDYLISTVRTTSYWGYIAATNIQATIENVSAEKYANFTCAIPPFLEQEAIVTYLDAKCIALDTLIAKTERSIELLREKRQALITAAVTGKIDVRPLAREIVPEAAC